MSASLTSLIISAFKTLTNCSARGPHSPAGGAMKATSVFYILCRWTQCSYRGTQKPLTAVSFSFSNIKNKKFDSLLTAESPDQSLIGSKV